MVDLLESLSLAWWYDQYPWAVDGIVYLALFTGLAHVSIGRRFHGRPGAAMSGALGLGLAVGATLLARRSGFTLEHLGPLAWLALFLALSLVLFDFARAAGLGRWTSAAIAVVGLAIGFSATTPGELVAPAVFMPLARLVGLAALIGVVVSLGRRRVQGGVMEPVPMTHSPTPHAAHPHGDAHGSSGHAIALTPQIQGLIAQVADRGLSEEVVHGLEHLARAPRIVDARYRRAMLILADLGYRVGQRLDESFVQVMLSASKNIEAFRTAQGVAIQAAKAGNAGLVIDSLRRLFELERASVQISSALDEAVLLMSRHSGPGSSGTSPPGGSGGSGGGGHGGSA